MSLSPFMAAINQICDEKGLPKEIVVETVEAALAAAYRKDYGHSRQSIRAKLNEDDIAQTEMFQVLAVVKKADLEDEHTQIAVTEAKKIHKGMKVGEELLIPMPHQEAFGRIAAQTAKQVIIQRLREAERELLYREFKDKEGTIMTGQVQQLEGPDVIVNLGKINAILLPSGQIPGERYNIGQRMKVFVVGVEESTRGPRVLVSRTDPGLIKGLFTNEVPEIISGTVDIKTLAREAGSRTKMAVTALQPGLDPVGSCVGQRGVRVQAVLAEIGDEKIDIILWADEIRQFIANALSPAKVSEVIIDEGTRKARVIVPEDQTSLAIGRGGQNVRLASKLTGYSIDIEKTGDRKSEVGGRIEGADEAVEDTSSNLPVGEAGHADGEEAKTTKGKPKKKSAKKSGDAKSTKKSK